MPTFDIRDDEQVDFPPAHTPGPWAISSISQETGEIGIAKDRIVIAYATNAASFGDFINATLKGRKDFGAPDTAHTQFANARLIAASPELLDVCKFALAAMNSESGRERAKTALVAVIAKATGAV